MVFSLKINQNSVDFGPVCTSWVWKGGRCRMAASISGIFLYIERKWGCITVELAVLHWYVQCKDGLSDNAMFGLFQQHLLIEWPVQTLWLYLHSGDVITVTRTVHRYINNWQRSQIHFSGRSQKMSPGLHLLWWHTQYTTHRLNIPANTVEASDHYDLVGTTPIQRH